MIEREERVRLKEKKKKGSEEEKEGGSICQQSTIAL